MYRRYLLLLHALILSNCKVVWVVKCVVECVAQHAMAVRVRVRIPRRDPQRVAMSTESYACVRSSTTKPASRAISICRALRATVSGSPEMFDVLGKNAANGTAPRSWQRCTNSWYVHSSNASLYGFILAKPSAYEVCWVRPASCMTSTTCGYGTGNIVLGDVDDVFR